MMIEKMSYLKAKARLENLEKLRRIGRADENEIRELNQVLATYTNSDSSIAATPKPEKGFIIYEPERVLSNDAIELVKRLENEARLIDNEKNILSNSLYDIPDTINCKDLVLKIKELREKWRVKGDEIRYVKKHGKLASTEENSNSEFVRRLPQDLLELDRKLRYRKSDLSKYKQRLSAAKTENERAKQERNIAQAEIEIRLIKTQINALR